MGHQFKVGDRVIGKFTKDKGVIVGVAPDGQVLATRDLPLKPGRTHWGWGSPERFYLDSMHREEGTTVVDFKVGDRIVSKNGNGKVIHVVRSAHNNYLWVQREDLDLPPFTAEASSWKLKATFFEVGKLYYSPRGANSATFGGNVGGNRLVFTPEVIRVAGETGPVAFGRYDMEGANRVAWVTFKQGDFDDYPWMVL